MSTAALAMLLNDRRLVDLNQHVVRYQARNVSVPKRTRQVRSQVHEFDDRSWTAVASFTHNPQLSLAEFQKQSWITNYLINRAR